MKSIKEIEADGGNLVLTLTEGNADMPLLLSDYHLVIQPNGGNDDPRFDRHRPYKLVSFEPACARLSRRTRTIGALTRGYVDSIEIIGMNDATARIAALSSGQVHYINRVDPKDG